MFRQLFLTAVLHTIIKGDHPYFLKDHYKEVLDLFDGLSLKRHVTNDVVAFLASKGIRAVPIEQPSNCDIPLIRGPASYFKVQFGDQPMVLVIASGSPHVFVHKGARCE